MAGNERRSVGGSSLGYHSYGFSDKDLGLVKHMVCFATGGMQGGGLSLRAKWFTHLWVCMLAPSAT